MRQARRHAKSNNTYPRITILVFMRGSLELSSRQKTILVNPARPAGTISQGSTRQFESSSAKGGAEADQCGLQGTAGDWHINLGI